MNTLYNILFVFLGSGLGGVCRWAISSWANTGGQYPLGTLAVNIVGCFVLGVLTRLAPGDEHIRLLLMTGFCGGFTTFSTLMSEQFFMLRSDALVLALLYVVISLALGLLATWGGFNLLR